MLKVLVFLVLCFVAYRLLGGVKADSRPGDAVSEARNMVTCTQCGVNFPEQEAVLSGDRIFCCQSHRDAWKQNR